MPNSISNLLIRNLRDVFGENDPTRRRAAIDEIFTEDSVFYDPKAAPIVDATRSIASRAPSRLLILTFDISQLPSPRSWAVPGGYDGYRAALARCRLTPGLISSLPGTGRLPLSISFSTSCPDLESTGRGSSCDVDAERHGADVAILENRA